MVYWFRNRNFKDTTLRKTKRFQWCQYDDCFKDFFHQSFTFLDTVNSSQIYSEQRSNTQNNFVEPMDGTSIGINYQRSRLYISSQYFQKFLLFLVYPQFKEKFYALNNFLHWFTKEGRTSNPRVIFLKYQHLPVICMFFQKIA